MFITPPAFIPRVDVAVSSALHKASNSAGLAALQIRLGGATAESKSAECKHDQFGNIAFSEWYRDDNGFSFRYVYCRGCGDELRVEER